MIRSKTLGMDTDLTVVLPGDLKMSKAHRVVYLLHPLGGDAASYVRWTSVERYAAEHGFAVVMPEVQRSFYIDMQRGPKYFTYITEEIPELVKSLFGLVPAREDTFVSGASMGGYGSLKAILSRPDLYGACACFSGAYDLDMVKALATPTPNGLRDLMAALGDDLSISGDNDLQVLAERTAKAGEKPRILMCCGDTDFLLGGNLKMHRQLDGMGYDVRYRQWKGAHNWAFWDQALPLAFDFFDGIEPPEKPYM